MEKQIKAGMQVRSLVTESDVTAGTVYTITEVRGDSKSAYIKDNRDHAYVLWAGEYEIVPERRQFQARDIVTPNETCTSQDSFTIGREYIVRDINCHLDAVYLESDDNGSTARYRPVSEFDLVRRPSEQPATVYLVIGPREVFTTRYDSIEAAEQFISEVGDNGKEYIIAPIAKTVRVNRTTTLETV
jgi:hypothetical protein